MKKKEKGRAEAQLRWPDPGVRLNSSLRSDTPTPLNPSCARRRRSLRPPPHPRIRITHATPAMATSSDGGGDQRRLLSIPKEGERIIAPTRRPDGTLRKAIRIRAGYVPQEEVAIYQSKGALMRKSGPDVPPGYDPALVADAKPKTKAAKRNERRKEKRQQASSANDKGKSTDIEETDAGETDKALSSKADKQKDSVESVTKQISSIAISESHATPSTNSTNNSQPESSAPDIDKKIRALKKKIRLAEAQLQGDPEKLKSDTLEKMKKIDGWRMELKLLEDKRAPEA
ncbi:hypothetical protein BDA96_01G457400 [Sorghum bicolor]|uniref:WIBG Mago-binding domain-containing protein n=2 Tax=Sorghum bicolor TaxID=4558 RepID=A0A921S4I5_SORBI|nr:hypothetical protein BDA96_01G457400 [Sorghum bicolor]